MMPATARQRSASRFARRKLRSPQPSNGCRASPNTWEIADGTKCQEFVENCAHYARRADTLQISVGNANLTVIGLIRCGLLSAAECERACALLVGSLIVVDLLLRQLARQILICHLRLPQLLL